MTRLITSARRSVGLAGLGHWGKNILRDLHPTGLLHTVCDPDEKTLVQRSREFHGPDYTSSFEELLDCPDITALVIATPAATHYDCARRALLAGRDVLVEKPLALRVGDGEELVRLAEERGRILMVGHLLHYHPAVTRLKEMVDSGELGKIRYIYANRLNIGRVRTEENVLWSFAPHDISVMLMLMGSEPCRVGASGGCYLSPEVHDTTMTVLEFEGGVKGHIFVSWLHPFKEQKLVVVCSDAMAVFDDQAAEKLLLYRHQIEWKEGLIPVAHRASGRVVDLPHAEPLKEELMHFLECVEKRRQPRTDGREGLRVLRVLDAAEKALRPAGRNNGRAMQAARATRIHETAWVDEHVSIGDAVSVWHFSHILGGSTIGNGVSIGQNVSIGPDVSVGDGCKIQNNVSVYKGVTLEEGVFCGPSCVFTNVYNPRAFIERKHEFRKTLVKKGATIGANATVVCGVTIGRYAMVGAGAVVKTDVPDHAVVAGVPAVRIGWACRCGTTLRPDDEGRADCRSCGDSYFVKEGLLLLAEE